MRVLLAEDDPNISVIAKISLEKIAGYDVTVVSDGESALNEALTQKYDLILLDEMMPKMNGIKVCQEYKARVQSPAKPVIFLSAKSQDSDIREFTDNGTGTVSATNGWRIWASTWTGETRGNVQPDTSQPNFYGCSYGAGCVWGGSVPLTGDHFVYIARPTVIVTANGTTKVEGAPDPAFSFTTSGLINGDTAAGTLTGSLSTPATQNSPPGQYPINPAFLSSVGYVVVDDPGTLTVTAPPMTLDPDMPLDMSALQSFFGASEKTFVYENNLQGTNICVGSNEPLFTNAPPGDNQDLLAVEWKRVRSQPNLNSCMLINGQHGCGDF